LKIQKTGNLKEDVIISFLHSMCEVFQQHYFLKISIKENFIYFFRGRYLERKGGGKEKKNSKKCKEIILHPSEFFTMEIKVQFWIRYQ
jgi:hypothetical protein